MEDSKLRCLKSKIILQGYNLLTFSETIGWSYQTLYNKINSGVFSNKEISQITELLNLTDEERDFIFF